MGWNSHDLDIYQLQPYEIYGDIFSCKWQPCAFFLKLPYVIPNPLHLHKLHYCHRAFQSVTWLPWYTVLQGCKNFGVRSIYISDTSIAKSYLIKVVNNLNTRWRNISGKCILINDCKKTITRNRTQYSLAWVFLPFVCMYVRRFQNVVLRCQTPRLHCFLSSHWPSFRFL